MADKVPTSLVLDRLDRQILHAVRLDGRAAFSDLANILGSSEQTVARRYRRLREAGVIRVLVLPSPVDASLDWHVRLQVRPGAAARLADALARRADVSWVSITSGGAEVICITRPSTGHRRDALLLDRLPRIHQVTGLVAHSILHSFMSAVTREWDAFDDPLTEAQTHALLARRSALTASDADDRCALAAEDQPLLEALMADGRASYAALSASTGWTPTRVARRLEQLLAAGAISVDADLAIEALGFRSFSTLWCSVVPAHLQRVGEQVAALPQTAFAAAITGPVNLMASVVCRDSADLFAYLTDGIGSLEGVTSAEVSPTIRRVKQAASVMQGPRIAVTL